MGNARECECEFISTSHLMHLGRLASYAHGALLLVRSDQLL